MPQEDGPGQGDKDLFYPIILVRQIALMLGKLGLFFVVIMAMYAELDEIGNLYFGENGQYVTLAFSETLLSLGISHTAVATTIDTREMHDSTIPGVLFLSNCHCNTPGLDHTDDKQSPGYGNEHNLIGDHFHSSTKGR